MLRLNFYGTVFQGTLLVNNSDQELKWGIDLRSTNKAIEEGVFKFVHPSGAPFPNPTGEETKGIEGELKPGETQQVAVMFCPSKSKKMLTLFVRTYFFVWQCYFQWN